MVYDERLARSYIEGIVVEVDKPVVEAALKINGTDVVVTPRAGRAHSRCSRLAWRNCIPSCSLTDGSCRW